MSQAMHPLRLAAIAVLASTTLFCELSESTETPRPPLTSEADLTDVAQFMTSFAVTGRAAKTQTAQPVVVGATDVPPTSVLPPTPEPTLTLEPAPEPSLTPVPTLPPRPDPLVRFDDPIQDTIACVSRALVDDAGADVVAVNLYAPGAFEEQLGRGNAGHVVEVETQQTITQTIELDFSFATMLHLGPPSQPFGRFMYEIHAGEFRIGELDQQFKVIADTDNVAQVDPMLGTLLFFLPPEVTEFSVEVFHTPTEADAKNGPNCDRAPDTGAFTVP